MEAKKAQLENFRSETLVMQKEAIEAQKKIAEQEKRLNRRSLDVEKQVQNYMLEKSRFEECFSQHQQLTLLKSNQTDQFKNHRENVLGLLENKESLANQMTCLDRGANAINTVRELAFEKQAIAGDSETFDAPDLTNQASGISPKWETCIEALGQAINEATESLREAGLEEKFLALLEEASNPSELDRISDAIAKRRKALTNMKQENQELLSLEMSNTPKELDEATNVDRKDQLRDEIERLWSPKSIQNLENLILQSEEYPSRQNASVEHRIQELNDLEHRFREIEFEMEDHLNLLEQERNQELDAIDLEKFRLEELKHQKRISALVEWEVRRRLLEEQRELNSRNKSLNQREIDFGSLSPRRWKRLTSPADNWDPLSQRHLPRDPEASLSASSLETFQVERFDPLASRLSLNEYQDDGTPNMPFKIIIPSFVVRGSGSSAHYEYEIKIWTCDDYWTLYRRYKRFRELHLYVKHKYGDKAKMPYFPPKKIFGNRSEKVVLQRRKCLETYLQELLLTLSPIPICPLSKGWPKTLIKKDLCQFSTFFQKGCFETSRHNTG